MSSQGLWVGTEQKRSWFCLKELFALNRHPNLLIQGKGEEGKEGAVTCGGPTESWTLQQEASVLGASGGARSSLWILHLAWNFAPRKQPLSFCSESLCGKHLEKKKLGTREVRRGRREANARSCTELITPTGDGCLIPPELCRRAFGNHLSAQLRHHSQARVVLPA